MKWVFVVAGGLFFYGASLFGKAIRGAAGDSLPMILGVGLVVCFLGVVASFGIAAIPWRLG